MAPELKPNPAAPDRQAALLWAAVVGIIVLACQWCLVARAGTDIPYWDQWDLEGKWLYPAWHDGTLRFADLFQPHNQHRLVSTYLLDLFLFKVDGQWDPLLQMTAGAALHALGAFGVAYVLAAGIPSWRMRGAVAFSAVLAFLPLASWFNALCGLQTNVYFALIFSFAAFACLGAERPSWFKLAGGVAAGVAAMLSLGAGELVPVALLGLAVLRLAESRQWTEARRAAWPALILLVVALVLAWSVPVNAELQTHRVKSAGGFMEALIRALAWPHSEQPLAALALNLPLAALVIARVTRRRQPRPGEDFVLLLGGWALANAVAMAWARGGDWELQFRVPSRYADFVALLPLANVWCALTLATEAVGRWRLRLQVLATIWGLFLIVGWLGDSLVRWHDVVRPRIEDRLAPARLAVAFQTSGDASVFAGQRLLYDPNPDKKLVLEVLRDPRLQGRLPPSFQPQRPLGPLSGAVRKLLGQE